MNLKSTIDAMMQEVTDDLKPEIVEFLKAQVFWKIIRDNRETRRSRSESKDIFGSC